MATQFVQDDRSRVTPGAMAYERPLCFIDGEWVEGEGDLADSFNPYGGASLGAFRYASALQACGAIAAARRAFDSGPWPATQPAARGRILHRLADLMAAHRDALIDVIIDDVGTPRKLAAAMQVDGPIKAARWFAEAAVRGPDGWYERSLLPHTDGAVPPSASLIRREANGVVAAIATWNFPFTTLVWKLVGALAAGCTVVFQPSPKSAHSSMAFWRLIEQLDLPPGVVNMVLGDVEVGQCLTSAPEVDMVTFTGSVGVGGKIMAQAAPTLKKMVLELGGKSPAILMPGVDLDDVVKSSIDRLMGNAGQRCGATSRILVHRAQLDRYLEMAAAYLAGNRIGDPRDGATDIGPLIDGGHRASVQRHVDRALADGGRILAGATLPPGLPGDAFMAPLLIGDLPNDAALCQEELFGPVGAILPYGDVDEAVSIANASRYGLNAMVFGPTAEAVEVAKRLRCGTVTVNGRGASRYEASWGGYRQSGVGREGGDDGFREFFETKHIQWSVR